jgi:hypothetical protein
MNTTTHLARHILAFQPNKDAARLSFYHYLIHHCDPDTPLSPQLIENFCRRALCYEHWQQNSSALSQELQYILQHYNETYILNWSLKDFIFPDRWQIINVKNSIDTIYVLEKWVEKNFEPNTKKRIIFTKERNFLILIQNEQGELSVVQTTPSMLLKKGEIEPLCTDLTLQYDQNLELKKGLPQHLLVATNTTARFRSDGVSVNGMVIRGYIFQKQQDVSGKLNTFPSIFYPLKRVEQYFIDKKSDPTYQELIQVMEKAVELININHPEAHSFAQAAYDRGQAALENIFTNDNVIQVLVDQLHKELQ